MENQRIIPAGRIRNEFPVSNSLFITTAAPAFSVEEAKDFITEIKAEYQDATHNVPAYIIGHPPSTIEHSSDDGEPSGTAGKPALAVLRGSGFGDIAVVITRYFGGTKLGTGGLVRAYGDSMREILSQMPKAQKIATVTTQIVSPYPLYDQINHLLKNLNGNITNQDFGLDVTITVQFIESKFPTFQSALVNLTHGSVEATILEHNENTIMPFT
ncbi:IMPACT family protein [bacterium]|nr:IMPACT family protein [bacterium]